ncbi:hypothetical protein BJ742DRAFT_774587 [Cladochytrium replicatum]|nr:hypothetical protein BJ742DRAFT_774587 [Cladochytrium replicatum]
MAFQRFESYAFDTDSAFQDGAKTLIAKNVPEASLLKMKWFYYNKFVEPFDFEMYLEWKAGGSITDQKKEIAERAVSEETKTETTTTTDKTGGESADTATAEPSFPLSFAKICEMVARGEPIPGIKQIPDKINEEAPSASTLKPRRKPWERKQESLPNVNSSNFDGDEP